MPACKSACTTSVTNPEQGDTRMTDIQTTATDSTSVSTAKGFHERLTASEWEALLERQRELEAGAMALGRKRFEDRVREANLKGRATTAGAAVALVKRAVDPMEQALTVWLEESLKARGRRHQAIPVIRKATEEEALRLTKEHPGWTSERVQEEARRRVLELLSAVTVRVILDMLHVRPTLRHVADRIVKTFLDELKFRRFEALAPKLFQYRLRSFTTANPTHMARSLSASMGGAVCTECQDAGWTPRESEEGDRHCPHLDCSDLSVAQEVATRTGIKLVDLFIASTGLVMEERKRIVKGAKAGKIRISPRRGSRRSPRRMRTTSSTPRYSLETRRMGTRDARGSEP